MNVYYTTDFEGHWPVGTSAVIVAKDKRQASKMLLKHLTSVGLVQKEEITIEKLDIKIPLVIVLQDGDY